MCPIQEAIFHQIPWNDPSSYHHCTIKKKGLVQWKSHEGLHDTLVGGLEHVLFFPETVGNSYISSSQLTFTHSIIFQRGKLNHQPDILYGMIFPWYSHETPYIKSHEPVYFPFCPEIVRFLQVEVAFAALGDLEASPSISSRGKGGFFFIYRTHWDLKHYPKKIFKL